MLRFPKDLPNPSVQNYAYAKRAGIVRTQVESGQPKYRKINRNVPDVVSMTWELTEEQFEIFEAWYKFDAKEGLLEFIVPHLASGGIVDGNFRFLTPQEPYQVTPWNNHGDVVVTARMERIDDVNISELSYKLRTLSTAELEAFCLR